MSSLFKSVKDKYKNKVNRKIVKGYAVEQLPEIPSYLDTIIRSSIKSISPEIPFKYLGYKILSPDEDIANQGNITDIDISNSTLYKVTYTFEYNEEPIERTLSLPYVKEGGILVLSDAKYSIVPVLTEYVISSAKGDIFTRLMKDKLIFKKLERVIMIDGRRTPIAIVISDIYKLSKSKNPQVPVALLLFIKYGFKGLFKSLFNTTVVLLVDEEPSLKLKDTHTIFSSTGKKPRGLKDLDYIPHNIIIAVPKDKVSQYMESVITSLIWTFDTSNVFSKELKNVLNDSAKEKRFWKLLLGKVIFRNSYTYDKIFTSMNEYIGMIDGYMDDVTQKKLRENNIILDDFYDLIALVIRDYNMFVVTAESRSTSSENRYLDINYYLMFEHIAGINKAFFAINKEFKQDKLTYNSIVNIFNKQLSAKKIFNLIKGGNVSLALIPVDYSGDNYYPKITSMLEDQNRGQGVKRSKTNVFPFATRTLHAEDLNMGNLLYLSKKSPTPRLKVNPYVDIDFESGKIKITKSKKSTLEQLEEMLSGKTASKLINSDLIDSNIDEE